MPRREVPLFYCDFESEKRKRKKLYSIEQSFNGETTKSFCNE